MSGPVLLEVRPETLDGADRPIPEAGLSAGRVADNGLVIDSARASRRQFRIVREGDRWCVEDTGSAAGTLLNGRRVEGPHPLQHNDVVSLANERDPYWLFQVQAPARNAPLERAVVESDTDEAWRVYGDWLLERGDALGGVIAEHSVAGAENTVSLAATPSSVRGLQLQWRYGFWRSAEVSGTDLAHGWPAWLAMLLHWPRARFLRSLRVNIAGYERDPIRQAHWLGSILKHAPPTLEHLELGAGFSISATAGQLRALLPRWDGQRFDRWTADAAGAFSVDALSKWLSEGCVPSRAQARAVSQAILNDYRQRPPMQRLSVPWTELAVIALLRGTREDWRELVGFRSSNEYDHYMLQQMGGVSKDDLGEPMSDEQCDAQLRARAISFLKELPGPVGRFITDLPT